MTVKVFKSTWTWRTLTHQDRVLAPVVPGWPDVAVYEDEEGLSQLFRPTMRKSFHTIYISSVGLLGKEQEDVEDLVRQIMDRGWRLVAVEENLDWKKINIREVLDAWQYARINGAARVGAQISAKNRRSRTEGAIASIKERWRLPSNLWPTKILLEEADVSLNSVKSVLGSRIVAQKNYQAMLKRKDRQAKGVRYKRADGYIDEVPDDHRN